ELVKSRHSQLSAVGYQLSASNDLLPALASKLNADSSELKASLVAQPKIHRDQKKPGKQPEVATARINCFGQAHVPLGVTGRTSGPHPRPDPPSRRVVAQGAESFSRETF